MQEELENPGSLAQAIEKNPELTRMQVQRLWEKQVIAFQKFLRTYVDLEFIDD